jgi:hypothetical protein
VPPVVLTPADASDFVVGLLQEIHRVAPQTTSTVNVHSMLAAVPATLAAVPVEIVEKTLASPHASLGLIVSVSAVLGLVSTAFLLWGLAVFN